MKPKSTTKALACFVFFSISAATATCLANTGIFSSYTNSETPQQASTPNEPTPTTPPVTQTSPLQPMSPSEAPAMQPAQQPVPHLVTPSTPAPTQGTSAHTNAATDRAGLLKEWREKCNDPDPDLRLAYIEQAILSNDTPIQRICTKIALESDNNDIRNLGLRTAISASTQITFHVEMPQKIADDLKKAGNDEDRIKKVTSSSEYRNWEMLKNGLVFEIESTEKTSPTSVWYPMIMQSSRYDGYKGKAVITGNKIVWVGRLTVHDTGSFNLTLHTGGEIKGNLQVGNTIIFAINAKLL